MTSPLQKLDGAFLVCTCQVCNRLSLQMSKAEVLFLVTYTQCTMCSLHLTWGAVTARRGPTEPVVKRLKTELMYVFWGWSTSSRAPGENPWGWTCKLHIERYWSQDLEATVLTTIPPCRHRLKQFASESQFLCVFCFAFWNNLLKYPHALAPIDSVL